VDFPHQARRGPSPADPADRRLVLRTESGQVRAGEPLAATASSNYLAPIGGLGSFGPYVVHDPLKFVIA
jgi:hypothetical protein